MVAFQKRRCMVQVALANSELKSITGSRIDSSDNENMYSSKKQSNGNGPGLIIGVGPRAVSVNPVLRVELS